MLKQSVRATITTYLTMINEDSILTPLIKGMPHSYVNSLKRGNSADPQCKPHDEVAEFVQGLLGPLNFK